MAPVREKESDKHFSICSWSYIAQSQNNGMILNDETNKTDGDDKEEHLASI